VVVDLGARVGEFWGGDFSHDFDSVGEKKILYQYFVFIRFD
jgi:hypothetical protein